MTSLRARPFNDQSLTKDCELPAAAPRNAKVGQNTEQQARKQIARLLGALCCFSEQQLIQLLSPTNNILMHHMLAINAKSARAAIAPKKSPDLGY